jgi:hypothetical protein
MSNDFTNNKVEAAVALSGRFRIFPLPPNSKVPVCKWKEEASRDPKVIREWFKATPDMNYGVVLGKDHFGLDLDLKNGKNGESDLANLEIEYGEDVPETFTQRTPSSGLHKIYEGPASNSVGKIAPGIDIRGDGGYLVGPYSVIDGKLYEIVIPPPFAKAPKWLGDLVAPRTANAVKADLNISLDLQGNIDRARMRLEIWSHKATWQSKDKAAMSGLFSSPPKSKTLAFLRKLAWICWKKSGTHTAARRGCTKS